MMTMMSRMKLLSLLALVTCHRLTRQRRRLHVIFTLASFTIPSFLLQVSPFPLLRAFPLPPILLLFLLFFISIFPPLPPVVFLSISSLFPISPLCLFPFLFYLTIVSSSSSSLLLFFTAASLTIVQVSPLSLLYSGISKIGVVYPSGSLSSQTLHYFSPPFPYFCHHHHHHHHHAIVLASFTVLIYVLRSQQSRDDVTDVSMTTRTDRAPGCSSEDGRVLIGNVQRDVPIVWIGGVPRSGTTLMRDLYACLSVCLSVSVSVSVQSCP